MNHIAFFLPDLSGGGAERVLLTLSEQLIKKGYKVDLVLERVQGNFIRQLPQGVRLVNLGKRYNIPTVIGLAVQSFVGLVHYLRRNRPDAILSSLSRANILMAFAGRLSGTDARIILREANTFHNHGVVTRSFMRISYPAADKVVAVSKGIANDLKQLGALDERNVKVIYNPVNIAAIRRMSEQPLDHEWFRKGAPPVVLAIGRLTEQKDFPVLIRAFALLRRNRSARLVILGEGKLGDSLQRLAESLGIGDDFLLAGFVGNPYQYIQRSSIVAVSSKWEGMINVLIEALTVGTPVVSTDCHSGPAEILEDGRFGRLVPVGDIDAFAAALEETLDHPITRDVLQSRADDFSVDSVLPEYLDVMLKESG